MEGPTHRIALVPIRLVEFDRRYSLHEEIRRRRGWLHDRNLHGWRVLDVPRPCRRAEPGRLIIRARFAFARIYNTFKVPLHLFLPLSHPQVIFTFIARPVPLAITPHPHITLYPHVA